MVFFSTQANAVTYTGPKMDLSKYQPEFRVGFLGDEAAQDIIARNECFIPYIEAAYGVPAKFFTFKENSLIKSKYFSKKTGLICLSDDSGLEIDILDKRPGIYSARWGGKNSDFRKAIKKVYRELNKKNKNWNNKKIKARFVCALTISFKNKNSITKWAVLMDMAEIRKFNIEELMSKDRQFEYEVQSITDRIIKR